MENEAEIVMYDSKGTIVYSKKVALQKGNNTLHIQETVSAPGIHYVQIKSDTFISNSVKVSLY